MKYKYEVTLSFAGEDRNYAEEVAKCLSDKGIKVFYDKFEEFELWGKDLYEYFDKIYRNDSRFCVMFLSKHYAKKAWTNHERKSAQARSLEQSEEYILPVKLDDTQIQGIRPTTGYIDGRKNTPEEICNITLKKLGVEKSADLIKHEEDETLVYIPKIKRTITDLERKKFLKTSFTEIKDFFEKALIKLKRTNTHIETDFDQITPSKFVASIYVEGQLKAQCKIWVGGMFGRENSISFSEGVHTIDINNDNSLNDSANVVDDGIDIFFELLGLAWGYNFEGLENINLKHASPQNVAQYYWARFTNYLKY